MLGSYDFNSFYPSGQIDLNSAWPKMETVYPFEQYMSDAVFSLFNSGRWIELNGCASLTVNYHIPNVLVFQRVLVKEEIKNPYKNNRLEEVNRIRNGIIIDTLTSVDIVEIVKCFGIFLEVLDGFFCHNL